MFEKLIFNKRIIKLREVIVKHCNLNLYNYTLILNKAMINNNKIQNVATYLKKALNSPARSSKPDRVFDMFLPLPLIFTFVMVFATQILYSQTNNASLFNEGNTLLQKAYSLANENNSGKVLNKRTDNQGATWFDQSKKIWEKVLDQTPLNADANFKMGLCYYFTSDNPKKALPYFLKSISGLTNDYKFVNDAGGASPYYALYFLAQTYLLNSEPDSALKYFSQYRGHYDTPPLSCEKEVLMCSNAKKSFKNPRNVNVKFLESINTEYAESNPVMKLDNSLLFFSSRRSLDKNNNNQPGTENIYYVTKTSDGKWSEIKPFPYNSKYDEEPMAISSDGHTLYLMIDKKNNADIYISHFKDSAWSKPEPFKEINTKYNENGFTISNDGNEIYFSSDRPGGVGGFDIYYLKKNTDGKWGKPQNIGLTINTPSNEVFPNLSPDGKSLYFSSDGFIDKCIGGFDIYFSDISDDKKFGEPVNLGYPINTTRDDINLCTSSDGKRFYSRINEDKSYDIAEIHEGGFDFNAVDASTEVVTVTNEMNVAQIMETEKEVEKEVAVTQTVETEKEVEKDVDVIQTVETEKEVIKEVEVIKTVDSDTVKNVDPVNIVNEKSKARQDTTNHAKSTNSGTTKQNATVNQDLFSGHILQLIADGPNDKLSEIEERGSLGKMKALTDKNAKTIYFDLGISELSLNNIAELNSFIEKINKYPGSGIEIIGYCDVEGSWKINFQLSVNRAKSVYFYLMNNHISEDRMIYYGKGNIAPVANNDSDEGRGKNRRVEIIILPQKD